jgi:hypothetical protein
MDFLLPALLGLLVFAFTIPISILKPHNVQWLNKGDAAIHLIGLHYFFQEPWLLPPGKMTYYGDGLATSIVYSDSVPLIAIPAKWMVRTFGITQIIQPFGIFIALGFVLQGVFGFRILRYLTKDRWISLLGVSLILLSPPLFLRLPGHLALGAQWLIFWALSLFIQPAELTWKRNLVWLSLLGIALGIHFYLFVMCGAIYGATLLLGLWKHQLSWRRIARYVVTLGLFVAATGWFFGYFVPADAQGAGYGYHKFNLLSFFNPMENWSRLFPGFAWAVRGESDGFAWFGIGIILVAIIGSMAAPFSAECERAMESWKSPILIATLIGLLAAALTPYVNLGSLSQTSSLMCVACGFVMLFAWALRGQSFHGHLIWQRLFASPLVGLLSVMIGATLVAISILPWVPLHLREIMRASGRMAWPVYYWFACWAISLVAVRFTKVVACVILGICIALQAFDMAPKINQKRKDEFLTGTLTKQACSLPSKKMTNALWMQGETKKRLWIVTRDRIPEEVDRLGLLAIRKGMKINCPGVARWSQTAMDKRAKEISDILDSGNIPEDVVYYVYPNARAHAKMAIENSPANVEFVEEGGFTILTKAAKPSEELAQSNRTRWELATPCLSIQPGQTLSFTKENEATLLPSAFSGFSDLSADGVWTDQPEACMTLKVSASQADLQLAATVCPFLNPRTSPGQLVKIYANGVAVGEWSFTTDGETKREVSIPKQLISVNSLVFLKFEIPHAVSPKKLRLSSDTRKLGLRFIRIESIPDAPTSAAPKN